MLMKVARIWLALAILTSAGGVRGAQAQDFLNEDWVLNPTLSNVYMQTVKLNAKFETHQFTSVEGNVGRNGDANVRIDLASIETYVDLRNVRMRFLLFEVFKFPRAVITARIDKSQLQELATKTRISYSLALKVAMHGVENEIKTKVWITRISDTAVSVATIEPIVVTAESFGLTAGVGKLADAVGGILIAPAASLTFDLMFGTGAQKPELEAARAAREKTKAAEASKGITAEACETRFSVISQTGAIYFKTGSAELDRESAPLLNSVAEIANLCPTVKIDVAGHTDNVGSDARNQQLSEERSASVVAYLAGKGIAASRIQSAGYGGARPVASNESDQGRAKNRRIEFMVKKN